jgi:hypothetical protein
MSHDKDGSVEEGRRRLQGEASLYACPCCRNPSLPERGGFEVCPFCFWEDDGQDDADADEVRGGPNGSLSLSQARRNYAACGACDERFK